MTTTTTTIAISFPAVTAGGAVTEAHVRYCAEHGHATHKVDGKDTGVCPRCGEVKTAAPAPSCYACDWNLRSHQHTCR